MITGSGRWMPPPLPAIRSPEHEKDSGTIFAAGRSRRVELERTLTDPQMNEFEDRLCALALERSQIKEAMGFALGNADAAGEIVEVLTESLTLKETPMPTKDAGTAMRPLSAAVTAAGGNASYVLDGVPRILSPAYFHHYNARLMPADLDTWKQRRRVIAPGFHALYLEAMTKVFTECLEIAILKFEKFLEGGHLHGGKTIELDLEAEFSNLALNIMELGVFNYDFGSVTKESPVIRAVYGTLFEAEHRSTFYIPYWKVPLARWIGHRQQRRRGGLGQVLCQKP